MFQLRDTKEGHETYAEFIATKFTNMDPFPPRTCLDKNNGMLVDFPPVLCRDEARRYLSLPNDKNIIAQCWEYYREYVQFVFFGFPVTTLPAALCPLGPSPTGATWRVEAPRSPILWGLMTSSSSCRLMRRARATWCSSSSSQHVPLLSSVSPSPNLLRQEGRVVGLKRRVAPSQKVVGTPLGWKTNGR